ncbi:MAG: site-2 protease family protein [Candidatus Omnitrophica bacterium]|nr:site-2 protease family protein [Candidatus Omnitrophota bacterium]
MSSIRLFRLLGVDVKAHWTFVFLPLFFGFFYGASYGAAVGFRAFVLVILVFVCVLGHELTHSLRAKAFGIRVPQITLYPIGGVASMQRIPRDPRQEFLIAIVGPLFNFMLAALLYFPLLWLLGRDNFFSPSLDSWPRTFANAFWINPILGFFNLIPAFPMDGGRVLRAILATRMTYLRATRISANLGTLFAILFFLLGIWWRHGMLALIAIFIYTAASSEKNQVQFEEFLEHRWEDDGPKKG